MLQFPVDYFQDEVREGFLVDTTMKTVWAAELEVLNEIAIICARHGFEWYAAYGTLLGSVRHQGFIPWDDDIDIWMKREDYRKLLEILPEELPEGYIVRAPYARAGYPEYQVYVNNSDSISIEPERLNKFHGCPFYVGIDIFPLDIIPADREMADVQRSIFSSALMLQQLEYETKAAGTGQQGNGQVDVEAVMSQIEKLIVILKEQYGIIIYQNLLKKRDKAKILEELWRAAESILYGDGERDWKRPMKNKGGDYQLAMYLDYLKFGKAYKAAWFEKTVYLPFEGFDIPVPENYDEVLKVIYGDYGKPVRSEGMHDYPCYKRQLEELRKKVAESER